MDAKQALKQTAKYDYGRERLIVKWVEETLGEKLSSKDLHEALRSGIILCRLLNCVKEGMTRKYNTRSIARNRDDRATARTRVQLYCSD